MIKLRLFAIVVSTALLAAFLPVPQAKALDAATFIARTVKWAQEEERQQGVPASVSIAQAMLESGMGDSKLTKEARNWFGIKCSSWTSPHQSGCYTITTTEYDELGNPYRTTARFRNYTRDQDSFIDHGYLLRYLSRYKNAFNYQNNADRFITEVAKAGYATDPQYANKVIRLMVQHNLYQYNLKPMSTARPELVIRPQGSARVGATAVVTGLVSPGAGRARVWTQAWTGSRWATSQSVTSGSRGEFSIPLTYGGGSVGVQRFRVQAATSAGTLTSAEFTLERVGNVTASASKSSVVVGDTATLTGRAAGYSGRTVQPQVLSNGSWVNTGSSAKVNADGSYRLTVGPYTSTGTRNFRARLTTASGLRLTSSAVAITWQHPAVPPTVRATSAGSKLVGETTNTWGSTTNAPHAEVWTEVLVRGSWLKSQTRTTDGSGSFVIPLTYGSFTPGVYTWRVGVRTSAGTAYSNQFTLERIASSVKVKASSAGTKPINQQTFTWGTASGAPNSRAWTEVLINGRWVRSQVSTTSSSGSFVIPLTYGASTPGTYRWRVGVATDAGTAYSNQFTLTRTS